MKKLIILLILVSFTACTSIPNPKIAFGKKCVANGERVTYSYVWIYDSKTGLPANTDDCDLISDKK